MVKEEPMGILQAIKTAHIKVFLTKQSKVQAVEQQIRVLKEKLTKLKEDEKSTEQVLIAAMERGVKNMSKMYALQVKPHDTLPYINWRKEFEEFDPDEYASVVDGYDRKEWKELLVSPREV